MDSNVIGNNTTATNVSQSYRVGTKIWFTYVMLVQSCFIVLTNLFVIIVMWKVKGVLPKKYNFILVSLFTSHFSIGLTGVFIFLVEIFADTSLFKRDTMGKKVAISTYHFCYLSSFCMIILTAADRYIAVRLPFMYNALTVKRYSLSIVFLMIIPNLFFCVELFVSKESGYTIFLIVKVTTILVLSLTTFFIYRTVQYQYRQISLHIVTETEESKKVLIRNLNRQKIHSIRVCLRIVFSTVIFWFPAAVTVVLRLILGHAYWNKTTIQIQYLVTVIASINSLHDPLITVFSNKRISNCILNHIGLQKRRESLFRLKLQSIPSADD